MARGGIVRRWVCMKYIALLNGDGLTQMWWAGGITSVTQGPIDLKAAVVRSANLKLSDA